MSQTGAPRRGPGWWASHAIAEVALAFSLALSMSMSMSAGGCASTGQNGLHEGLDAAQLPEEVRPDYALFARRCSKCHSLARPLNSGITDDEVWVAYVNKMRRQPGSGISPQDAAPILRFLHFYSSEQRRLKRAHEEAGAGAAVPASRSTAAIPDSQSDSPNAGQTANR